MQEIAVEFVYSKQKKMEQFFFYRRYSGKLWVKGIMANTFLDAVTNADVLTASNNDVKLVDDSSCKIAWLKSSSYWESKETLPPLTVLANFTTYLPPEIPGDITFISSILKLVQRW